jgi:Zn-dependent protease with chaperone function
MANAALLPVSALFFVALTAALYVLAWGFAAVVRALSPRLSHAAAKRVLLALLALPPGAALLLTVGGVTYRHGHLPGLAGHHNLACGRTFADLSAWLGGMADLGAYSLVGTIANAGAWLLLAAGAYLVVRLGVATIRLERGLTRCQNPPTARLAAALARVGVVLPGRWPASFFECPIPPACSSVLGFHRPRCVLSADLVSGATDAELDAIVAHEASHLQSGDVAATLLVGALNCLFFYLRPVRLLGSAWRREAELACDDAAVGATGQPLAMAAAILRVQGVPINVDAAPRVRPLPAVSLAFADGAACPPAVRVERLIRQAEAAALLPGGGASRRHGAVAAVSWAVTRVLGGTGLLVAVWPQVACVAHCSLEAATHLVH